MPDAAKKLISRLGWLLALGIFGFCLFTVIHWTMTHQGLARPIIEFQTARTGGTYFPKITILILLLPPMLGCMLLGKGGDWLSKKL
ncbi:MAG: hypothetical protein AAFN18_20890 [Cyanobacteria bacterium J06554_6]